MSEHSLQKGDIADWIKGGSMFIAVGIIGILLVMMIPLPTCILDILLSFNITFSLVILLVAVFVMKPLDFSVFPSVLLVATLFRLSLNVASTRLILLHGSEGSRAAGRVIESFGSFVVGGNFVIGLIVFLVLVLINFIVITKGATRIAEVAARFTLDAMPGKQMSIDADLNAGLITDDDARRRRGEVEQEADFYGAMDGASKFVRGDAIAGVIITLINIIGGLVIGVFQQKMAIGDAARAYTLLTVGDGLVTQIPALIVSTAAGMLVTRSTSSTDLGKAMKGQIFLQPRAIATAAGMLFIFGAIPGMPTLPFVFMAVVLGFAAYIVAHAPTPVADEEVAPPAEEAPSTEPLETLMPLDTLELDVGYNLISLVDANQGGELLHRIKTVRKQLATEMGFIVPAIHIRDDLQLNPNSYVIKLKSAEIARGELMMGHHLVISPDKGTLKIKGIEAKEPAFGLPAVWIPNAQKEDVQARGMVVVDCSTVATTHITEVIKDHADELISRQDVQNLIDNLASYYPKVVDDAIPSIVTLGVLHKVLQRLLRERVSIRDLITIIETLSDYVPLTKNADILTGYVRQALSRTITKQYVDLEGTITVVMVASDIENGINESLQHTEYESFVTADPSLIDRVVKGLQGYVRMFTDKGLTPVVLCSPNTRIHLHKIIEKFFPHIAVVAHNELTAETNVKSLGMVG